MSRRKSKPRIDTSASGPALTSSPFAGLAGLRDSLSTDEVRPDASSETASRLAAPPAPTAAPARAVVRFQRKGRGGKEVTLVEQLDLAPAQRERWLKELKQALGCGGVCEGPLLVLQGDQRERLPDLLRQRGVRRVSLS